jgi:uncharacterized membrane protein
MLESSPLLVGFFDVVRAMLELLGVLAIVVGAVIALVTLLRSLIAHERASVTASRYELSRYLALALEFQLSADIVGTAIAPSWTAIGRVAAIVVIRTTLNYFLTREVREEREQLTPRVIAPRARSDSSRRAEPVNPDE